MTKDIGKTSHIDLVQNPDVSEFLQLCSYMREPSGDEINEIVSSFLNIQSEISEKLPDNIITINSSSYEAHVREDIPYTNIGYVKLVTMLLKHNELSNLGLQKFVDPFQTARLLNERETISFVLPSSNIKYADCETTKESFRRALDFFFEKIREDQQNRNTSLKSTLFWLASYSGKNEKNKIVLPKCPNEGCDRRDIIVYNIKEAQFCPSCGKRVYATDRLRLYEEIDDYAPSNQGVLKRFEKLIRHIYLAHTLRMIRQEHKESSLKILNELAIIINGPLAIMGTAAWVHGSLMKIINEINIDLRQKGYQDFLLIGVVNGGEAICSYAQLIKKHLSSDMLLCVSDEFRDKYININREASSTTFGAETYYGQDFIWMNKSNDVVVFDLPYFTGEKSNKDDFKIIKSDYTRYNNLMRALRLLKEMKSDMEERSVMPLVISKQYTAISMEPGAKVLDMLSKNSII